MDPPQSQIVWGRKKNCRSSTKDIEFYESFTYDHVEYSLYDCVYLFKDDDPDPYIGKILKLWDRQGQYKKVKILWFFHPSDVKNHLKNEKVLEKEIFMASGDGPGLADINTLEAISGKCSVVCTSKDPRNKYPSDDEIARADYIFYRVFDVARCELSEELPENIGGVEVQYLLNWGGDNQSIVKTARSSDKDKKRVDAIQDNSSPGVEKNPKRRKVADDGQETQIRNDNNASSVKVALQSDDVIGKKDEILPSKKLQNEQTLKLPKEVKKIAFKESDSDVRSQVVRRSETGPRNLFKALPWKARLQNADKKGSVVYIQNLDMSYSEFDVENMIHKALDLGCSVRYINHPSYDDPRNGKAYAIFRTVEHADEAIQRINSGLLFGGRPLICSKGILPIEETTNLVGHLSTDKIRRLQKQSQDMKKAVSTSHCSQPNTIEYDMALEWILLQEKLRLRQMELRKCQRKEREIGIKKLTSK